MRFFLLLIFVIKGYSQKIYFISQSGNDLNTGTSAKIPWKTLKDFKQGNTYLFHANDTFYINIPKINIEDSLPTTISSYGKGAKPLICGYRIISPNMIFPTNFQNVWQVDINNNLLGGLKSNQNENVGFLIIKGKIYGNKCKALNLLKKEGDFYDENGVLYIYALSKPNNKIYFACRGNIITLSNNLTISDLRVEGSGSHGVQGVNVKNVRVKNLDISNIGGAYLKGFGNGFIRYGNGIEFWESATNCYVEYCSIKNVYDAAFTAQGRSPLKVFSNIVFRHNNISYCEQAIEFWQEHSPDGFKNCSFSNNKSMYAGYGWSHDVRPDTSAGVHVLVYFPLLGRSDVKINDNTFTNGRTASLRLPVDFNKNNCLSFDNNSYYGNNDNFIYYNNGEIKSIIDFKSTVSKE
ncbi:right-handed parallel beta-helix repeat-containing protein [Flavobacterium sp. P21]|uniref:right-handed parallel beta-helix repeat-containing protein n=1 Tax=Flavobacterium sp. P21 TaxID=3423948 RepID=UPI003D67147B